MVQRIEFPSLAIWHILPYLLLGVSRLSHSVTNTNGNLRTLILWVGHSLIFTGRSYWATLVKKQSNPSVFCLNSSDMRRLDATEGVKFFDFVMGKAEKVSAGAFWFHLPIEEFQETIWFCSGLCPHSELYGAFFRNGRPLWLVAPWKMNTEHLLIDITREREKENWWISIKWIWKRRKRSFKIILSVQEQSFSKIIL